MSSARSLAIPVALASLLGCRSAPYAGAARAGTDARGDAAAPADSASPDSLARDSLALAAPGGASLWFTARRNARDAAGRACIERAVELRRGDERHLVPLLYTGEAPTLANDSTAHVHLWRDCRAGDLYAVSLRTGRPTRVAP
jgi:hypothetical protein